MGYTTSTIHGIEVPDSAQANNIPTDLGKIVTALEGGSIVKRLTSTQINALTSGQKPAGLLVFNSTTNKLQISNGSTFTDVIDASGGTMGAALAMGGSKITGLGAGTANGDAVRYEQAVLAAGSTMTGALTLSGAPSSANHAATKAYVDAVGTWCQGVRSSDQSIANGSLVTLTYTSETDAANMLNTSTGVVTIPTTGVWMMTLQVDWASAFTTDQFTVQVLQPSGSTSILATDFQGISGGATRAIGSHNLAYVGPLTANATYKVIINQNSGSSKNVATAKWGWTLLGTT